MLDKEERHFGMLMADEPCFLFRRPNGGTPAEGEFHGAIADLFPA
jgi:hypothetical protein